MQKHNGDSSNVVSPAADCAKTASQHAQLSKGIEAIDSDELSTDDLAYYTEVMGRCSAKLIQAAA